MARALKLFRTAIGFHDAYVAAASRKAALVAWGTDKDLFARGVAEQVDDPDLLKRLEATPGDVFQQLRGSAEEHHAALPKTPTGKATMASRHADPVQEATPRPKPPRPRDDKVREAKSAMTALAKNQDAEAASLRREEAALARKRRAMEQAHSEAMDEAQQTIDQARADYDKAVERWRKA